MNPWLAVVRAEWIKRRRSAATWIVLGAAAFVPAIVCAARLRALWRGDAPGPTDWSALAASVWEANALLLLPLLAILLPSLLLQIETRNNAWKQVHAGPQPLLAVYAAKLGLCLVLLLAYVACVVAGIAVVGYLPPLVLGLPLPEAPFPLAALAGRGLALYAAALPVLVLQFVLALHVRSFAPPLAMGTGAWILALGCMSWSQVYWVPYNYPGMLHLQAHGMWPGRSFPLPLPELGALIALVAAIGGALGYLRWRERL